VFAKLDSDIFFFQTRIHQFIETMNMLGIEKRLLAHVVSFDVRFPVRRGDDFVQIFDVRLLVLAAFGWFDTIIFFRKNMGFFTRIVRLYIYKSLFYNVSNYDKIFTSLKV